MMDVQWPTHKQRQRQSPKALHQTPMRLHLRCPKLLLRSKSFLLYPRIVRCHAWKRPRQAYPQKHGHWPRSWRSGSTGACRSWTACKSTSLLLTSWPCNECFRKSRDPHWRLGSIASFAGFFSNVPVPAEEKALEEDCRILPHLQLCSHPTLRLIDPDRHDPMDSHGLCWYDWPFLCERSGKRSLRRRLRRNSICNRREEQRLWLWQ